MKITTKFDIGQEVWLIHGNSIVKDTIECAFYSSYSDKIDVIYHIGLLRGKTSVSYKIMNINEMYLFATKEELIKSL